MMNGFFKNIQVILLFIAGLAIGVHMIIPHDHHPIDSFISQDDTCPVSKDKTQHPAGFPVHCHACNDLTSEKAPNLIVSGNLHNNFFVTDAVSNETNLQLFALESTIYDFTDILFISQTSDLFFLRAPPALS